MPSDGPSGSTVTVNQHSARKNVSSGRVRRRIRSGTRRSAVLPVRICEDHNRALQILHDAIREGTLPFAGSAMVHLDAHPDLGVPQRMSSETVFRKWDLYHHLENSESGIADWIMPAVFAGHLDCVAWIRPPWATQIRDCETSFQVGVRSDCPQRTLAASTNEPYFADDGHTAPLERLSDSKPLTLFVAKLDDPRFVERLPCLLRQSRSGGGDLTAKPWVLDICLDYFATRNPYMDELRGALGAKAASTVQRIGLHSAKTRLEERRVALDPSRDVALFKQLTNQYHAHKVAMHTALDAVFAWREENERHQQESAEDGNVDSNDDDDDDNDNDDKNANDNDSDQQRVLLEHALRSELDQQVAATGLAREFVSLVQSLPMEQMSLVRECIDFVDLPECHSTVAQVRAAVDRMHCSLTHLKMRHGARPSIVTIARSSRTQFDYLDAPTADRIQNLVIDALGHLYGHLDVVTVDTRDDVAVGDVGGNGTQQQQTDDKSSESPAAEVMRECLERLDLD